MFSSGFPRLSGVSMEAIWGSWGSMSARASHPERPRSGSARGSRLVAGRAERPRLDSALRGDRGAVLELRPARSGAWDLLHRSESLHYIVA